MSYHFSRKQGKKFRNKVALPSIILVIFVLQGSAVHVRALQLNAMALMPPLSRNFLSLEPPTQQHQHSPSVGAGFRSQVQKILPRRTLSDGAVTIISQDLPKLGAAASQLSKIFPCRIPSDATLDSSKLNKKVLELKENGLAGELHGAWVEGGEGEGKLMTWSCDWKCGFRSTCFDEVAQHRKTCTPSHEQCPFVERRWIFTAGPSHTGDREVSNTPHQRHSAQHL